jgi:hypothetical protein
MSEVELSAGTIEYDDTGGDGPVLVFLHGVALDGPVWAPAVADLRRDHRCVVPTLPLGAHRWPTRADADLSLRGFGRLAAELLERPGLDEVTLVHTTGHKRSPARSAISPAAPTDRHQRRALPDLRPPGRDDHSRAAHRRRGTPPELSRQPTTLPRTTSVTRVIAPASPGFHAAPRRHKSEAHN